MHLPQNGTIGFDPQPDHRLPVLLDANRCDCKGACSDKGVPKFRSSTALTASHVARQCILKALNMSMREEFVYLVFRWAPSCFFPRFGAAILLRGAGALARPVCLPVSRSPRSVGRSVAPVGRSVGLSVGQSPRTVGQSVDWSVGQSVPKRATLNQP